MPAPPTPARAPRGPGPEPGFLSTRITEARRYFVDLARRVGRPFEVVCGGVERCRHDYVVERRSFPYCAVEFVAEGLGRLRLGGRDYLLRPGVAFAYAKGIGHTIRSQPRSPMLKYYVDFAGPEAERLLRQSPLGRWEAVQVSAPQEIVGLFEELQRHGETGGRHRPEICAHLAALLLLKITERAMRPGAQESRAFPSYQRARQHLEKHYLELRRIEEAAAACHLNVSYLCRLFQRYHHQSPYQFLMRLKMNRAAGLLLDGGLQVKEVANELRFSDPYTFSRAFKTVYGLSPQDFVRCGRRGGGAPREQIGVASPRGGA